MSHLLKALERIIYKHIASFMENKFLPYLCGFRKKSKCAILAFQNGRKLKKQNWAMVKKQE